MPNSFVTQQKNKGSNSFKYFNSQWGNTSGVIARSAQLNEAELHSASDFAAIYVLMSLPEANAARSQSMMCSIWPLVALLIETMRFMEELREAPRIHFGNMFGQSQQQKSGPLGRQVDAKAASSCLSRCTGTSSQIDVASWLQRRIHPWLSDVSGSLQCQCNSLPAVSWVPLT